MTRNDVLREFLRRCDTTREALEQGLLDMDDQIRLTDGYRAHAEQEIARIGSDEKARRTKQKKLLRTFEQQVHDFLAGVDAELEAERVERAQEREREREKMESLADKLGAEIEASS